MAYSDLLLDPRWQQKRLRIFERDQFTCRHCLDATKTLHVHHIKYSGGFPWDIDDKFLITLCDDCHEFEEYLKDVDIYDDLKSLGITKYQSKILIRYISDNYSLIGNVDFFSWIDTIKMSFKNG